MTTFTLKQIDELKGINEGAVKLAGAELGIQSFGMQVLDFPSDFSHYPEHDHADEQMEEVYVVLRGSARFTIDSEEVDVREGGMVSIEPDAGRRIEPGPDGVRILAIGCTRGGSYERPEDFRLESRS